LEKLLEEATDLGRKKDRKSERRKGRQFWAISRIEQSVRYRTDSKERKKKGKKGCSFGKNEIILEIEKNLTREEHYSLELFDYVFDFPLRLIGSLVLTAEG